MNTVERRRQSKCLDANEIAQIDENQLEEDGELSPTLEVNPSFSH